MRLFGREWGTKPNSDGLQKDVVNAFNKALYEFIGGQDAQYDHDRKTYLNKGFGTNPDVYAVITQQADKLNSIPYYIKKIGDKESRKELKQLQNATKGNYSITQLQRKAKLEKKAFEDEYLPFPLEQPNPNQTWSEIWALTKVFEQTCGNYYLYMVKPEEGVNKGEPREVYILPSHLMKIVIKKDADILEGENIIDHYMLIEGNSFLTFDTNDVIHVKLPNPFFDFNGGHLYGLSPLSVLLRNIESSNDAIAQNVKTMKNGGVFGFIHSKEGNVMNAEQATQLKEKMKEMDRNPARLSHIAGASVPLAFTKISLTTDELKPFDFLAFDQKMICNVLGWSTQLLNNDEGSKYGAYLKEVQKNSITNHMIPRLTLLEDALNKEFIPLFKGYENAEIEWDWSELPEMQSDVKEMVEAYSKVPITPNEMRELVKLGRIDEEGMDVVWVDGNRRRIDEQGLSDMELDRAFKE